MYNATKIIHAVRFITIPKLRPKITIPTIPTMPTVDGAASTTPVAPTVPPVAPTVDPNSVFGGANGVAPTVMI